MKGCGVGAADLSEEWFVLYSECVAGNLLYLPDVDCVSLSSHGGFPNSGNWGRYLFGNLGPLLSICALTFIGRFNIRGLLGVLGCSPGPTPCLFPPPT